MQWLLSVRLWCKGLTYVQRLMLERPLRVLSELSGVTAPILNGHRLSMLAEA
jgi:hypothetical protein